MGQVRAVKVSSSGSLNLASLLAFLWILGRAKRRQDPDRPQIVSVDRKSEAVLERARQLVSNGREDPHAVAELRALARDRRRTLRNAEHASRMMGHHYELRQANLANRLLQAALSRKSTPQATSASDAKRIDEIEAFKQLTRPEQWARLVEAQPALIDLEADVRSGRFGHVSLPHDLVRSHADTYETSESGTTASPPSATPRQPFSAEQRMKLRQFAHAHAQLTSSLEPLVGPRSEQSDPALASQCALEAAERHLNREARGEAD